MITISSKAGQRLAKARAASIKADKRYQKMLSVAGFDVRARLRAVNDCDEYKDCLEAHQELKAASDALADELLADRHHLAEGD